MGEKKDFSPAKRGRRDEGGGRREAGGGRRGGAWRGAWAPGSGSAAQRGATRRVTRGVQRGGREGQGDLPMLRRAQRQPLSLPHNLKRALADDGGPQLVCATGLPFSAPCAGHTRSWSGVARRRTAQLALRHGRRRKRAVQGVTTRTTPNPCTRARVLHACIAHEDHARVFHVAAREWGRQPQVLKGREKESERASERQGETGREGERARALMIARF